MKSWLFSGLVIFLTTVTVSASYDGNETDHLALLSFKSMITQDPYGALSSWNTSFHFCDWIGVSCGKRHRRVTVIRLIGQGLVGSLSPHVGNLSFLRELRLWNNSIQGTIPSELGRLSRLGVLDIRRNKFSGVIPTNLSGCSNLEELRIGNNELEGSIPNEISFLSKLTYLAIQNNNLSGGIPPSLGNITLIQTFSAPGNPLGGIIPDTLGNWKTLRQIYLGTCNLHGTIPRSILNLSLLTDLSLAENQLTGSLPSAFGNMVPNLVFLQLRNNQLDGLLPPTISNCSKLTIIEVNNNNFSGKMMIDFTKLRDVYHILLGNNLYGLREAVDMMFIDSLKNSSSLEVLDVTNGNFQGLLPTSIGNLSNIFRFLNLAENQLHGNLPLSIGNLVGLETLYIEGNRFTGNIPSTIGMLQKLQVVGLDRNQFSGPIPDAIGNLSILNTLDLHSNRLEGYIPSSLGNCHNLLGLDLSINKLTGEIPKQLLQLSSLSVLLNISQNNLFGSLPTEVGDLKKLSVLDLSYNNLSGNIPSSLGGCTSLIFLSLKRNFFQGIVPSSLSSLRGVVELDISYNNFSGQIPSFLEQFSLEKMNLSFNDFEGEVPVLGIFTNASAFSILGNSKLCGGLGELGLPKCEETKKSKKKFPLFVIVIMIAFTLLVALFFLYVWFRKKRKGQLSEISIRGQLSQSSVSKRLLKVSYKQLLKATDGFSKANLIGEGGFSSVYKRILDDDDKFVAVKVIHPQNRGADRSFIAECEVWKNTRHRNLLKIITSCSSVDFQGNNFKALVYEFMPNGSLHDWLHSSGSKSKLNLLQRINILINVADALDYLHNHCPTTIIHGDLKPSNILLDDDMVAHVGDFGLARFLKTDSYKNNSAGIRGTIGYAPPEYGLGNEMTSSGDIYSYGILLLEVMTGKKPTDDMFVEGLNLHKFAYMASPDHVTDVIEEDLKKVHHDDERGVKWTVENEKIIEECLALTLKIGVACSMDSPSHRMNIENVVHELQLILDTLQNVEAPAPLSKVDQEKVVTSEITNFPRI